ncbi:hypothetical protein KBC79_06000 [Candidatus Woesebacteria bacterium]|nr:hypothetical protein [Candidatus Woesebacteria bacterium]
MHNSARIYNLLQQLVEALADEVTQEARARLENVGGSSATTRMSAPSVSSLPPFEEELAPRPIMPQGASKSPQFETPDFDKLLADLEALRKDTAVGSPAPVMTGGEIRSNTPVNNHAPSDVSAGKRPLSTMADASLLLKKVTGHK